MPTLPLLLLACNISSTIEPEEPVGGSLRQIEIAAPEVVDDTGDASADAALADRLRAAFGLLAVALALWAARCAAVERQVSRAVRAEEAKEHAD